MKYLNTIVLLFCFAMSITAQEVEVKTQPKDVTLYLQSAKVMETGRLALKKGRNLVRITNLPNAIDINTYKIGLSQRATLLSITPEVKKKEEEKEEPLTPEQEAIQKKVDAIKLEQELINAEISAYRAEKALIDNNKDIDKTNENWSPEYIMELSQFYLNRMIEINKTLVQLNAKHKDNNKRLKDLSDAFNETSTREPETATKNINELVLEIYADNPTTETLKLTYIVGNVGWQPFYDVRVGNINAPLELVTKGRIYQRTGKDWKNVAMKVSTYLPRANQNRPILNPFYVRPQAPISNTRFQEATLEEVVVNSYQLRGKNDGTALSNVPVTSVLQQQLSVVYELKGTYDVVSDNRTQTLILDNQSVSADYKYHAVPKLTNDVFLLAHIKDWQNLNLMLTEANIYFEDNYVGKTRIDPNYVKSEYPISLGVDERINIKRNLIDNSKSKISLSSKLLHNFEYEISIRNNSVKDIRVEILDQIPISQSDKIVLDIEDLSDGDYDKKTGSILWKKSIKAGGKSSSTFKYTLKYPKDMVIQFF